ncbi:hypothetical protein OE88DRAFT_1755897 [Heliocybe sulcata]|uniref:F-box domain-containing protein n=1 Tax=Heliocybe sulcata TaxID=5364 RepID=A0A5C3N7P6_9AGAM|nr:hypothetical protein OE88DRAFT_1755897 [Heliocybe sulcata]
MSRTSASNNTEDCISCGSEPPGHVPHETVKSELLSPRRLTTHVSPSHILPLFAHLVSGSVIRAQSIHTLLHRTSAMVKYRINGRVFNTAVARRIALPPELLGIIFSILKERTIEDVLRSGSVSPYAWTSVALVSKAWRAAALQYHTLWTTVFTTNQNAMPWFLARSNQLPLTVIGALVGERRASTSQELAAVEETIWQLEDKLERECKRLMPSERARMERALGDWEHHRSDIIEAARQTDVEKWSLIREELPRIRKLDLKVSSRILAQTSGQAGPGANLLEDLAIVRVGKTGLGQADLSLFASPVLNRVRLSGAAFRFDEFSMLITATLTDLHISGTETVMTTGEVVRVLSCAPKLRTFRLGVKVQRTAETAGLVKNVVLQDLRTLEISPCSAGEADLLAFVRAPNIKRVGLKICSDFEDVVEVLEQHACHLTSVDLRRCTIQVLDGRRTCVMFTPQAASTCVITQTEGITIVFDHELGYGDLILYLLKQHLRSLLESAQCLSVRNGRGYADYMATAWREFFLSTLHIRKLQLSGHSTSTIPTGLVYPTKVGGSLVFHVLFPALESLELEGVWFWESPPSTDEHEKNFLDTLVSSILRRSRIRSPKAEAVGQLGRLYQRCVSNTIKRLTITRAFNLFEDDILLLETLISQIVWDELPVEKSDHDTSEEQEYASQDVQWEEEEYVSEEDEDSDASRKTLSSRQASYSMASTAGLWKPLIRKLVRNIRLHTARIFFLSSQDLHLTFTEHPTSHVRPQEGIHFELCVEDQGRMIDYMSHYLSSLWRRVTALYVRDGHYSGKDSVAAWHKLFRTMKRVKCLHLERKGVKVMPKGLHHYARNGIADIVFPVLRNLYLDGVWFHAQRRKNRGSWEGKAKAKKRSFLEDLKRSFRLSDLASKKNNLPNAHDGELDAEEAVVELEDGTRRTHWRKPKDDGKFRLVINNVDRRPSLRCSWWSASLSGSRRHPPFAAKTRATSSVVLPNHLNGNSSSTQKA